MNTSSNVKNVFQAVADVIADMGAVGKNQRNRDFNYRGIDDVINALHPMLGKHGVIISPVVKKHDTGPWEGYSKGYWVVTKVLVEYNIYGPDGSSFKSTVYAEGIDNGDKGPGKALSYAYKSMASQVFAICTDANIDNEETLEARVSRYAANMNTPEPLPGSVIEVFRIASEAKKVGADKQLIATILEVNGLLKNGEKLPAGEKECKRASALILEAKRSAFQQ